MASFTIEQLKKELSNFNIPLPPPGSKKAEYVKLYEQHMAVTSSKGDISSTEDESPSRNIIIDSSIENLSNDELYSKLQEYGVQCGPVVSTTRHVYERKLARLLSSDILPTGDASSRNKEPDSDIMPDVVLDRRIDALLDYKNTMKRSMTPESKTRHLESGIHSARESTPVFGGVTKNDHQDDILDVPKSKSTRISYIETIPKGSTTRIIHPVKGFGDSYDTSVRSRFHIDDALTNGDDFVAGRWSPNISRYTTLTSPMQPHASTNVLKSKGASSIKNYIIAALGVLFIVSVCGYLYFQWTSTDPYKLLADDVEKEIQQFTEKEGQE